MRWDISLHWMSEARLFVGYVAWAAYSSWRRLESSSLIRENSSTSSRN
jgi:hypothetical protein